MDLYSAFKLLLRHQKLLILTPFLTMVMIFFLTGQSPKTYVSSTLIHTGLASGKQGNIRNGVKKDYFRVQASFQNMIHLISSDNTIYRALYAVIDEINSDSTSKEFQVLQESVSGYSETLTIDSLLNDTAVYQMIPFWHEESNPFSIIATKKLLKTRRIGTSDLLEVSYIGKTPKLAQLTLHQIVTIFTNDYKELKDKEVNSAVAFFKAQMDDAHDRLQQAEQRLKIFREDSKIINYYEQTKYMADQVIKLELEQNQIRMSKSSSAAEIKKIRETIGSEEITTQLQDVLTQELNLINDRKSSGKVEVDAILSKIYKKQMSSGSSSNGNQNVNSYWRQRFVTIEGNRPGLIEKWFLAKLRYEAAVASNITITKELKRLRVYVYSFAPLGSELNRLERDAKVREEEFLEMQHNYSVAILTQRDQQLSSEVTVVDSPSFPIHAESSKRMVTTVLGGMVSFSLVIAIIFLLHAMNNSVRTPSRLQEITGLPTLLALPKLSLFPQYLDDLMLDRAMDLFHTRFISTCDIDKAAVLIMGWSENCGKSFAAHLIDAQLKHETNCRFIELPPLSSPYHTKDEARIYDTPAVITQPRLVEAAKGNVVIPVFSANELITPAMEKMVRDIQERGTVPGVILTNCSEEGMIEMIGELPKRRSSFRKWFKSLVQGQGQE